MPFCHQAPSKRLFLSHHTSSWQRMMDLALSLTDIIIVLCVLIWRFYQFLRRISDLCKTLPLNLCILVCMLETVSQRINDNAFYLSFSNRELLGAWVHSCQTLFHHDLAALPPHVFEKSLPPVQGIFDELESRGSPPVRRVLNELKLREKNRRTNCSTRYIVLDRLNTFFYSLKIKRLQAGINSQCHNFADLQQLVAL